MKHKGEDQMKKYIDIYMPKIADKMCVCVWGGGICTLMAGE